MAQALGQLPADTTQLWSQYSQAPWLAREVQEVSELQLPSTDERVRAVYDRVIEWANYADAGVAGAEVDAIVNPTRLAAISEAAALCDFFRLFSSRHQTEIPQALEFFSALTGTVLEKGAAIDAWMQQHRVQLSAIKNLVLGGGGLHYLPSQIGLFTGLRQLSLPSCCLVTLPAEIGQCTQLETLDLGGDKLISLPREIGNLTALEHLILAGNQLPTLPAELSQCVQLVRLDLQNNLLTDLPNIGQFTRLTTLFVNDNRLAAIPAEIGQCTALQTLDVSANRIAAIPREIQHCIHLRRLFISDNQLRAIPIEMVQCTALELLYLSRNPLELTRQEILARLPNIPIELRLDMIPNDINPNLAREQLGCWQQTLALISSAFNWIGAQLTNLWQGLTHCFQRVLRIQN